MTQTSLPSLLGPAFVSDMVRTQPLLRILDVRTPGEFESVHIPGSYNVPIDTLAEHAREIRTVHEAPVILVCQSGQRARKADEALRAAGMANLHILEGGVNSWLAAGLHVVRGHKRISLERQVRIVAGSIAAFGAILAILVNPLFALIPVFVGSGLVFAGVTDTCAMGMVLSRLSYNRAASCDPAAAVRALIKGASPTAT